VTETISLMPNKPKTPVSTFRLPLDLKVQAQAAAEANGTTLTAVIVAALEQYVKKNNLRPHQVRHAAVKAIYEATIAAENDAPNVKKNRSK